MVIDITVLASLALLTYLGYRKGFARQIIGFAAIIAVYFFAPPAGTLIRYLFFSDRGITFPGQEMASLAIAAVAIFIGVWLVGRIFIASITAMSERVEDLDMILGAVLGFLKGFLIVYLLLCALVYAEQPLGRMSASFGEQLKQSFSVAAAQRFNLITYLRYPELGSLREAMILVEETAESERNQALLRLLENEDFRSVATDSELIEAARSRDYSVLLSDERVLRLLADEDFRTVLQETDWEELADE